MTHRPATRQPGHAEAGAAAVTAGKERAGRLLAITRALGFARRDVPVAVVGPEAYVRWWQRLLAALALIALMASIGLALVAAIGLLTLVAGLLLEGAIS